MAKKYKIEVNKEECIGCGACYHTYPEIFELDENGLSSIKGGKKEGNKETIEIEGNSEHAKEAEENCPVNAIKITELK